MSAVASASSFPNFICHICDSLIDVILGGMPLYPTDVEGMGAFGTQVAMEGLP